VSGPESERRRFPAAAAFGALTTLGVAALVAAMVPVGPEWLGGVGAVVVAVTFTATLAARTGGRPIVFGGLALVIGVVTLVTGEDFLRTGAAVMTCVVAAVLGVMATVPAVRFLHAVRECVIATALGGIGALATVGFEPTIAVVRFEYVTFALSLAGAFFLVYRLGAGLHGLGRRGALVVVVGSVVLAGTLLYAELLRRYGTPGLVETLLDAVRWSRTNLGAFPRPIETVLGIPALAWGCHMRARRRQGWWVCAFGVAATSAAGNALVNPAITIGESALSVLYGLVLGLVLGWLVIRLDLALTGAPGARGGRGGRRARVADDAAAIRPEPRRTEALL
jgi:hypothetical protein